MSCCFDESFSTEKLSLDKEMLAPVFAFHNLSPVCLMTTSTLRSKSGLFQSSFSEKLDIRQFQVTFREQHTKEEKLAYFHLLVPPSGLLGAAVRCAVCVLLLR